MTTVDNEGSRNKVLANMPSNKQKCNLTFRIGESWEVKNQDALASAMDLIKSENLR